MLLLPLLLLFDELDFELELERDFDEDDDERDFEGDDEEEDERVVVEREFDGEWLRLGV